MEVAIYGDGADWAMFFIVLCACFWMGLTVGFVLGEWGRRR